MEFIYVSHRMQEFPLIGDRITILRDGVKISTVGINDCTNEELVNMMVGRDVSSGICTDQKTNIQESHFVQKIFAITATR